MRSQALNRIIAAACIALALTVPAGAALPTRQATSFPSAARPTVNAGAAQRRDSAGGGRQSGREVAKGGGQVGRLSPWAAFGGRTRGVLTA